MSERIDRDTMLMKMAGVASERGTCSRLQVGAVVSKNGRIIATGYNGAPAGLPHCNHDRYARIEYRGDSEYYPRLEMPATESGCQIAEHAERNAIAFAARYGLALEGGDMHVTHAPCAACARSVINAGIKRVFYRTPYRLTDGVELLRAAGLEVIEMSTPL
jgi:dCMP deaminase